MAEQETQVASAQSGAAKREAILAAAARMISESGVRGLRVEKVAEEAGVSPPLLYYHFASRSGLVRAALERASERAPSAVLREPESGRSGYAAVEAALLAELDDEREVRDNAVVWGEASATAVFEPELREDVRRVAEKWVTTVAAGIEMGITDGSVPGSVDARVAAEILVSLVDGLCTRWLAGAIERERARELVEAAVRATLGTGSRAAD